MTERKGSRTPAREEGVVTRERPQTKKPRRFRVILHNDDFTTMEFVVDILVRFFQKSIGEATQVMLEVHVKGAGVAGVYTRDVAETKIAQVSAAAEEQGFPLLLSMEPES